MTTDKILKALISIGIVAIPFLGMNHEANAIVIPIIMPMNMNHNGPETCTQINTTVTHCVPDPPSQMEKDSMLLFLGIMIVIAAIIPVMIWRIL